MKEERKFFLWLFGYGFVLAFFHIVPTFLSSYLKSPLTWGDGLDFLTPFAVIPLAYILYSRTSKISLSPMSLLSRGQKAIAKIILAIGFLLYVDGHGLHLSSNSLSRLLQNVKGSELFRANYLFDEIISHYMWDGGLFLVSIALMIVSSNLSFSSISRANSALLYLGAAFYGFTFTVNGIEGQTVPFTFSAAFVSFLITLALYFKSQKRVSQNPILIFFLGAYFLSSLLFAYWGISHSGFPQFSELGWIK